MAKALIFGITGQDGSYLAELLLQYGYSVTGVMRRSSTENTWRISKVIADLDIRYGDLTDSSSVYRIINDVRPDEIYNLAALSQVRISYDTPVSTLDITAVGIARILEAVRHIGIDPKIYQAGSSEMFGRVLSTPQNENTPFNPRSPYGISKAAAFYLTKSYREGYGLRCYNGILFNHESPRRGENFLSKKVVMAAARIAAGKQDRLKLGNLDALRDWGYAKDYAKWIYKIVQHPQPDDFVIGTGENYSVKDFVRTAFSFFDLDWEQYVDYDTSLARPAEVDTLLADYSKAERILDYRPKTKFLDLVKIMCDYEREHIQ